MQKIFELLSENNLANNSHLNSVRNNNNSELLFLQKKRNFETSIFHNKWSNMYPKNEVNFSIERENEKKIETKNSFKDLETLSKSYNSLERSLINDIKNYNNGIQNFEKMENLFKKLINLNNENHNHNIDLEESKNKINLNIQQQKNDFLRNEKFDSNNLIITDNKINNNEKQNT
jgi:chromosome segregation and condensation protein ScpB